MNWPTALIFTGMICLGIGATTMAYFAVKGFKMALVGKAYAPTFKAIGIVVLAVVVFVAWRLA